MILYEVVIGIGTSFLISHSTLLQKIQHCLIHSIRFLVCIWWSMNDDNDDDDVMLLWDHFLQYDGILPCTMHITFTCTLCKVKDLLLQRDMRQQKR